MQPSPGVQDPQIKCVLLCPAFEIVVLLLPFLVHTWHVGVVPMEPETLGDGMTPCPSPRRYLTLILGILKRLT